MTHTQIHAMILWHDKGLLPWSLALYHAINSPDDAAIYVAYWRRFDTL